MNKYQLGERVYIVISNTISSYTIKGIRNMHTVDGDSIQYLIDSPQSNTWYPESRLYKSTDEVKESITIINYD